MRNAAGSTGRSRLPHTPKHQAPMPLVPSPPTPDGAISAASRRHLARFMMHHYEHFYYAYILIRTPSESSPAIRSIAPAIPSQGNPIPTNPYHSIPSSLAADLIICCRSSVSFPFSTPSPLDSFEKAKRKLLGKGDCQIPRYKLREEKKLRSSIACLYTCCEYRVCELIICLQQQNAPAFLGFSQISANATRRDACVALPRHHIW